LFQPANRTHKISGQVIKQIRIVIVSGCFKVRDEVASAKDPMPTFGGIKEILTSILIVKSENLIKSEEIRYGN